MLRIALLPVDWQIDDNTIVQPDNLVVCEKLGGEACIVKAPVLIVEILSKSASAKHIIIDPEGNVAKIYGLSNGRYIKNRI